MKNGMCFVHSLLANFCQGPPLLDGIIFAFFCAVYSFSVCALCRTHYCGDLNFLIYSSAGPSYHKFGFDFFFFFFGEGTVNFYTFRNTNLTILCFASNCCFSSILDKNEQHKFDKNFIAVSRWLDRVTLGGLLEALSSISPTPFPVDIPLSCEQERVKHIVDAATNIPL